MTYAGRILHQIEQGKGEHWEIINLPAIAEEHDHIRSKNR